MNQDPLARGGVWDVRPPEHGLGRRRSPKRRQAAPAAPSRARAPSPLLPRIASRGDAGAGHARGNSVVNEMEARLAMLEERVSNVDRENGFLRHQLDTLGTSLQARLRQDNERFMDDMRRQFKMHAQTDALAQSTGAVTGQVLKRVAHLEGQVQRDAAALQQVQAQLRVSQGQGLHHGAGVGGGGGASATDVAAAAASAAQSARVAEEAHEMLAELRAALRARDAEEARQQEASKRQMQLLAVELQKALSNIDTLTMQLARSQARIEEVAAAGGGGGPMGRQGGPTPQGYGGPGGGMGGDSAEAVVGHMAALNRHVNEQLSGMAEANEGRFAMLEAGVANSKAAGNATLQLGAQLTELASALDAVREQLQSERQQRKEAEAQHMQVMVELRKSLSTNQQEVGKRLGEVVQDVGRNLVEVREHGVERLKSARDKLEHQQRARIGEEGQAFEAIATRFSTLEANLASEVRARQEEATMAAKTVGDLMRQLAQQVADEVGTRNEEVARLARELRAVQQESAASVETLAKITSRDRDMLAELVSTEIDERVKRDAKTLSDLNRYVQELAVAMKRVREACQSDTLEVRGELEELQELVVSRMAASAQALDKAQQQRDNQANAKLEDMQAKLTTVHESLQAAFREQTEQADAAMNEFTEQVTRSLEGMEKSMRRANQEEWKSRDEQRAEMAATMEQNAAAAADAITALQGVAAEDRERAQTALLELDERLSGRINDVQTTLSTQLLKLSRELTASLEDVRTSATEANDLHTRNHRELSDSVDSRFAVVQDAQVQASRTHQRACEKLAESLGEEHTTLEETFGRLEADLTDATSQLSDSVTRLYLKGFLSTVISDVEMRAIADDAAKQAVGELAEDQAPVMASVQADLIELKHRVLTQNEATVSAIQSTDRKATATVEALQHKVGMLLQDMEGRLTEADKEVAQRVMAAEANAQNLSRSVGEMVPTDQVSQVEAQAKANAAKTKELERRLDELTANIQAEQRSSDAAWQQTLALAAAFDTGASLPPVEELPALKPTPSQPHMRAPATAATGGGGGAVPVDRVGAGGGATAGAERGGYDQGARGAGSPKPAPAASRRDSRPSPSKPKPGDAQGSARRPPSASSQRSARRPPSASSRRSSRSRKARMAVDVTAPEGRQSPFARPSPGPGGASAMSLQSRSGAMTPESDASALDYRAGPIEPPSMLS